jgi:hypothetical protein
MPHPRADVLHCIAFIGSMQYGETSSFQKKNAALHYPSIRSPHTPLNKPRRKPQHSDSPSEHEVQVCGPSRTLCRHLQQLSVPCLVTLRRERLRPSKGCLPWISNCMCRLLVLKKEIQISPDSKRHIQESPPQALFNIRRKPAPITSLPFPNGPDLRIQSGPPRHRSRSNRTDDRLQQRSSLV